jgi:protoheme IX farnesyltransferase
MILELTKARLSLFVVGTTLVGFLMACRQGFDAWLLLLTILGTALTSSGALALNQWMEVAADSRMLRTRQRPLPTGRITPARALGISLVLVLVGLAILGWLVNLITALLAAIVVLVYTLLYTPLKSRSPVCTLVGAICGAIPPMMGWTAATGRITTEAWVLAAVLFAWQVPHFLALAWIYRDDYARGGFRMLPVVDRSGILTSRMVILYSLTLMPIGIAATVIGLAGELFLVGSLALGTALLFLGVRLHIRRSEARARLVFFGSLAYLPFLLGLMVADRGPTGGIEHAPWTNRPASIEQPDSEPPEAEVFAQRRLQ